MIKPETEKENLPVKGQDFANPKNKLEKKIADQGAIDKAKESDFSELEESRMENPPEHRETNGSDINDTDNPSGAVTQEDGVK